MAVRRFNISDYVKVVGFIKRGEWQNDSGDIVPMLTMEGTHEASAGNCYTVTGVCTGRGPEPTVPLSLAVDLLMDGCVVALVDGDRELFYTWARKTFISANSKDGLRSKVEVWLIERAKESKRWITMEESEAVTLPQFATVCGLMMTIRLNLSVCELATMCGQV